VGRVKKNLNLKIKLFITQLTLISFPSTFPQV